MTTTTAIAKNLFKKFKNNFLNHSKKQNHFKGTIPTYEKLDKNENDQSGCFIKFFHVNSIKTHIIFENKYFNDLYGSYGNALEFGLTKKSVNSRQKSKMSRQLFKPGKLSLSNKTIGKYCITSADSSPSSPPITPTAFTQISYLHITQGVRYSVRNVPYSICEPNIKNIKKFFHAFRYLAGTGEEKRE